MQNAAQAVLGILILVCVVVASFAALILATCAIFRVAVMQAQIIANRVRIDTLESLSRRLETPAESEIEPTSERLGSSVQP